MEDFELPDFIEDHPFSIDLNATDVDSKDIVPFWNLTSNVKWIKIEKETGRFYGTPLGEDCGTTWVNISVTDGRGGFDHTNKSILVIPVNDPPVILTKPVTSVLEDTKYLLELKGYDEDNDRLKWTCWTDADWLGFKTYEDLSVIPLNEATLFGTPTNDDVGMWSVKISLNDNNGSIVHLNFDIEVIQVNERPMILNDCPLIIDEGEFSFQYIATDEENDPLVWYLRTDAYWLSIDNLAGRLYGTTTDSDLGKYKINISVSDGNGGRDYREFNLDVVNVNDDPLIVSIPEGTAFEDQLYEFHFQAIDTDPTMDVFEWVVDPLGSWFTIDASSGWMIGTPENDDVGDHSIRVTVHDGKGGTDQLSFTIRVVNTNDPPYWIEAPKKVLVKEGERVVLQASAGDVDVGDMLIYGIISTPSVDFMIDEITGMITWESAVLGSYNVRITATDGNATIESSFWIYVEKETGVIVNLRPVIQPVNDQKAWVGELFVIVIMGHDPDTTDVINLNYSLLNGPDGSAISREGVFSWTPTEKDLGTHLMTIALNDTMDQTTMSFFIEVNRRPEERTVPWLLISLIVVMIVTVTTTVVAFMLMRDRKARRERKEDLSFFTPFYIKKYEGMAAAKPPLPPGTDERTNGQEARVKGP